MEEKRLKTRFDVGAAKKQSKKDNRYWCYLEKNQRSIHLRLNRIAYALHMTGKDH